MQDKHLEDFETAIELKVLIDTGIDPGVNEKRVILKTVSMVSPKFHFCTI